MRCFLTYPAYVYPTEHVNRPPTWSSLFPILFASRTYAQPPQRKNNRIMNMSIELLLITRCTYQCGHCGRAIVCVGGYGARAVIRATHLAVGNIRFTVTICPVVRRVAPGTAGLRFGGGHEGGHEMGHRMEAPRGMMSADRQL
ncbi:hypothetical protein FA95DRAFT_955238 [Auriscalpium vulgare]|uniref:Uncharacterized protein n=1 Tax=Auriscalpium vulgare TaxID=40419 RepID=A0ACB8R7V5_9AGAM|nr:hypothetical protein FA95DRAFT_955238 [Auriscalpium vulgare]